MDGDIKMTHTPGPWRVTYSRGNTKIESKDGTSLMCNETYYPWVPDNHKDWELISAAPELLDALENMIIAVAMGWDMDGVIDVAQSAIAKAKGQAQ